MLEKQTSKTIANYLSTNEAILEFILSDIKRFYKVYNLEKKNPSKLGEVRRIYEPNFDPLIKIQKKILKYLESRSDFGSHVQGFLKNRSIKTNAVQHLSAKFLLKMDILNFFESINYEDVKSIYRSFEINEDVLDILSSLSTYDKKLVTGSCLSPMLSNFYAKELDDKILEYTKANGFVYTRYADDITISGLECPSADKVVELIENFGLKVNPSKTKIQKRGQRQTVTGLSIFDESYPRIPKALKRKIRQHLHYIEKFTLEGHCRKIHKSEEHFASWMSGTINYMFAIEPKVARELKDKWVKLSPYGETSFRGYKTEDKEALMSLISINLDKSE